VSRQYGANYYLPSFVIVDEGGGWEEKFSPTSNPAGAMAIEVFDFSIFELSSRCREARPVL
jgi:hypothetical protein